MFNIVIFGPPGSGKGTQSKYISNNFDLIHISTGDVLRTQVELGSELGKEIANLIDKGNFVPDDMIQRMVKSFVLRNKDQGKGFVFDGFPRTTEQASWLDTMLAEINEELTLFLALDVDEAELKRRILKRGKHSGREDDQDTSIIENRISVYHKKTKPVIDYYIEQKKFQELYGVGVREEIFANIKVLLEKIK